MKSSQKSYLCLYILHLLFFGNLQAQSIYPGNLVINDQLAVDTFPAHFTEVEGSLLITGGMVTNLAGLSNLTTIGGSLEIYSTSVLTNLNGLNNLVGEIGADLVIQNNVSLIVVNTLVGLTQITGEIIINNNTNLLSIDGLSGIQTIGNQLTISGNRSLVQVNGLQNVSAVGTDVLVVNNRSLIDLGGLNTLNFIGGGMEISRNDRLVTLPVFANLTEIQGNGIYQGLIINNNSALMMINGFNAIDSINGFVLIANHGNLKSINGFRNLSKIAKTLGFLYNKSLTTIKGLDNLSSVNEDLIIQNNGSLISINGLKGLTKVGNKIEILNNEALRDINSLSNLSTIDGDLEIQSNNVLSNLNGLSSLMSIGGNMNIWFNNELETLSGLNNLLSVGGDLMLWDNDLLIDISGLGNLMAVGGDLRIYANPILSNLNGLEGITTVPDLFQIYSNPLLVDISGVNNIEMVGGDLSISYNSLLDECCVFDQLLNRTGAIIGSVGFNNNQTNCNNAEAIDQYCDSDQDGVSPINGDCDDNNKNNFPGNIEICDGIDNDCDGLVDMEDPDLAGTQTIKWFVDRDSDGFGNQVNWIFACAQPEGYVADSTDCNDWEAASYPGSPEICDGIDNNCDGVADDVVDISTEYEWIDKVKLKHIKNYSGNDDGYGDYTHLSTDLKTGYWYRIKMKPGFSGWFYKVYWRVWIDFNQDGSFDEEEIVVQSRRYWWVVKWFYIPLDALAGNSKMRVAMSYHCYPDACGSFLEGEMEDYTVNIENNQGTNAVQNEEGEQSAEPLADSRSEETEENELPDMVNLNSTKDLFTVYPNPTVDHVFIRWHNFSEYRSNAKISLTSASGQLIRTFNSNDIDTNRPLRLDLGHLSNGIYFITVEKEGEEPKTKQLIIRQ